MKKLIASLVALLMAAAVAGTVSDRPAPVRVLILSGQNNHDWASTTPRLKSILETTGRFEVEVTDRPDEITATALAPFDAILSNWNTFGREGQPAAITAWPEEARRAYLDFVRSGKGHVVVHAGSCSFADWPEYQQLTLAWWRLGQTQHGPPHRFPVRIETRDHPVMVGLSDFELTDELWVRPGWQPGAQVLASALATAAHPQGSGAWEPAVLADAFGEGRTFTLLFGHDAKLMEQSGFAALLTRGTEWAATGRVTLPFPSALARAESDLSWRRETDSLALLKGAQVIWQFNYGAEEAKPCFHPVALPDGPAFTWYRPADHRWHRALWFSWKFINGINYWEENAETGEAAGRTEWRGATIETRPDHSAIIRQELIYRPMNGDPVMTERRVIEVSSPSADGAYSFDWDQTFTAVKEVVLDRTPLPNEPGGQIFGGYAGLSIRLVREFGEVQALTTQEPVSFVQDRYRGRAAGFEYSGRIGEQDVGVAILDRPENLNAPSPWYAINGPVMRYFSPAVICYGAHRLRPGETLRLRYRVVIHPGRWSARELNAAATAYH